MDVILLFGTTLILLIFLLSMIWPPDSPWSPWWRTNKQVARAICKTAQVTKKDVLYDLGCGDGTALLTAAKEYGASGVGIEVDPARVAIAKVRMMLSRVSNKVVIRRENFFKTDISDASVIVVYLIPRALKQLEKKFYAELKPGTRVVSYMYQIPYLSLISQDKENKVYVYTIPQKHSF